MRQLALLEGSSQIQRVLAIGAHSDDIEIGCGATMLALRAAREVEISWVVLGADGAREDEARASATAFLGHNAGERLKCFAYRDGFFPYVGGEIKDVFEQLKGELEPDVIFTHTRHDLHQDHRLACELTWNTWRAHLILEYEVPKYDGDLGTPNVFVPVTREHAHEKASLLVETFGSQRPKHWFDQELFLALMRLRGAESGSETGYAEAFYARKLALAVDGQR